MCFVATILAEAKSFLVIHVSRIGDTLLATPAIRALAAANPGADITVLGHPKRIEILQNLPFISRVGGISKRTAPWRGRFVAKQYDCALVFGFDEELVSYASRVAKRVVAFQQKREAVNRLLDRAVAVPGFQEDHSVHLLLRLPAALGIQPAGLRLAYQVAPAERDWAIARLGQDVPEATILVGLQIASFPTKAYRDWPAEHFAALAEKIVQSYPGAHFLIFGGSGDQERTTWLTQRLAARATCYAGRLTLRQTAALMSRLNLYVGVDTGPTHIMSAFDIPLVGLYHCFSPSRLIGPLEHPCFFPVDHPRPYGCPVETPMAEITVDRVFEEVARAFDADPPTTG